MSTREKVLRAIALLSDAQIEGLYAFLSSFCSDPQPNEETLAAFAEADEIMLHPENYTAYTDLNKMFEDLGA